ncbi:MAG: phosphate ABC transporter ATP-binding protein [SAR324 cluster bacterium]|uniref:Phosphate ABC transporter ATP-binding protein n=1 Tax=SAR324 cluster bacterium TaxID=2024889 RepID=A0A2A4TAU8_9DELT|nr:MAG: phosphate ABC transporter ATP-binding protein [SAR324 cluster bacterium]
MTEIQKIEGSNLLKLYQGKQVLSCSLTLERDNITSIIGHNACGKSTLLRILSLLEKPDQGKVKIHGPRKIGRNPFSNFSLRKKITLVPAKAALLKDTVFNNIAYALQLRGYKKDRIPQQVEELLSTFDLEDKVQSSANKLSTGEAQRVALAKALALQPEALLLDEPTASQDPNHTRLVEGILLRWKQQTGRMLVIVTHDSSQAHNFSDRIIFMHEGRILENRSTEDFFNCPSTEQAKAFIHDRIH